MNKREKWTVDFHSHSNFSDGFFPPDKVIAMAAQRGLKALALTDHDTMDGLPAAIVAGRRFGIEVIPGVEISTTHRGEEIHLLGYYPSQKGRLPLFLKLMRKERLRRAHKILERLNELGMDISWEVIAKKSLPAPPGRLHFARQMLEKKMVSSIDEAFSHFLGEKGLAYFPRRLFTVKKALAILNRSGAVSVLAHPRQIKHSPLDKLLDLGIEGLEVFYPGHSLSEQSYLLKLAQDRDLLVTGGSDFHGGLKNIVSHPGYVSVEYRYLQLLRERAALKAEGLFL